MNEDKMSDNKEKDEEKPVVAKTAVDLQRLKLLKLMKNVDKPVILPERPKAKSTPSVPEFVRNVMGSSAGAGSGEFHVYRHLRRKEYARQKFIQEKAHKELLDEEYHEKLEENKRLAEEATGKKRAKRLKKKQRRNKKKQMKITKKDDITTNENYSEEDSSDDNDDDDKVAENNEANEGSDEKNLQDSLENVSTGESGTKIVMEKESSSVEEKQEDTSETSSKVLSESVQCENGT